ncbi:MULTISPECIES: ERF family protein [unclassified Sphingomonas]|uniref:ERF family protein n=1 Tax=Novosphingobium rhizosphaerae TaxID=1551649 RepID=UPI0015CD7A15
MKIDNPVVPAVYVAISNVMAAVSREGLSKGRRNQQQGYQFRGIDDVYNLLCGILAENKLVILPDVEKMEREERQTQKGGQITFTILTVRFKLVSAIDGSFDYVRTVGEAMDSADKSANKAQSAAMKYAELQVFQIPTEGDNDADASHHEVAARQDHAGKEKPKKANAAAKADGMPPEAFAKITQLLSATRTSPQILCEHYKVANIGLLNKAQFEEAVERLEVDLARLARKQTNNEFDASQLAGADL